MGKYILFAATGCALMILPALADTRDDVWTAMLRCQVIQDDRAWLDCTYGAKQPMRAKLGLPPAPEYQQRLVPPPSAPSSLPVPPPSLNASARKIPPAALPHRSPSILQILTGSAPPIAVSTLASVRYDSQGAFVLTLENGQVWHQVNADGAKARMKVGAKVTVTPGALQSYDLKTDDSPHTYKVERKT